MTAAAAEFVTPLSFAAISGQPVLQRMFPDAGSQGGAALYPHLYPATEADAFVLAPATANLLGKLAAGIGDDVVTTNALSLRPGCRRFLCPAMNVEMWRQPVVQENVRALEARGWRRIGPDAGALACGMEGEGRMAEPAEIAGTVLAALREGPLAGRRVLILSGPTREHLDPVRFVSNASTGLMGKALAEEAAARGAEVDFVTGPVPEANLPAGPGITVTSITSANELLEAARARRDAAHIVVYAAAVADFAPAAFSADKRPKADGGMKLDLVSTPDVAATLNADKPAGQVAVGFALQTGDGVAEAGGKMLRKRFDLVVLNGPAAIGAREAEYTSLAPGAAPEAWGRLAKRACAARILDAATARLAVG
jgi:phosphopantothenoylcysteine decarboxylase/phosphopantothenate--cysteine ligase